MSLSLSHNKVMLQHAEQGRLVNKAVHVRTPSGLQMVVYVFLNYSLHDNKRPLRHLLNGYVKYVCSTMTMYGYQDVLPTSLRA